MRPSANPRAPPAPSKKARTGTSPPRGFEIPSNITGPLSPAGFKAAREAMQSPLFFSNSPGRHYSRPSVDSVPDASIAATLAHAKDNMASASVTTVKIPSGNVRTVSPAVSTSTPGSLTSSAEFSISTTASPDFRTLPPNLQMLRGIGIVELLENDDRPTFMVDVSASTPSPPRPNLPILYYNASLRNFHEIHNMLAVEMDGSQTAHEFEVFRSWVMCPILERERLDLTAPSMEYQGIIWTKSTIRQRYRFISGNINVMSSYPRRTSGPMAQEPQDVSQCASMPGSPVADAPDAADYFGDAAAQLMTAEPMDVEAQNEQPPFDTGALQQHPDAFTNEVLQSQPLKASFDWTRIPISDDLPEHLKFAKTFDWSSTLLGPMDEWSYELRVTSNLIMGSPHPACLFWGPDFVCIYNEAYVELAGQKHPKLMGQRYEDGWAEVAPSILPTFRSAMNCGQATMKHDNRLFLNRNGFLEETVFSWSVVPIIGREGDVVGLYNAAFESTLRSVTERRMRTLREIGQQISVAPSVQSFWQLVTKALEYNEIDIPFSLIYSMKNDGSESDVASTQSSTTGQPLVLSLVHSAGVPEGHRLAPAILDVKLADYAFAPYMLDLLNNGASETVLSAANGTLPAHLLDGIQYRGYGDPSTTVIISPIAPINGDTVTGFMIMGTNPRRPYDDDYKLFTNLLSRQMATTLASVMLFEEEIRRGQRAAQLAALDRQELSLQLLQRTQEASESEHRFARMAQFAPVGMFIADSEGEITYCNDMWAQISRHSLSMESLGAWMDKVKEEDRPGLEAGWTKLVEDKTSVSIEFRFKDFKDENDTGIDTWVLLSAYPEKNIDGSLKSIFGCITDISSQKLAEKVQSERREEAVELKRQQENFIDITSHEMRNPLSAVLQCADQIVQNIAAFTAYSAQKEVENLLESCADAAHTINLCASHQKRIVDDILTLSKLDSNLLTVTPIDEKPVNVVQSTLKMFESELLAHSIDLELNVDDSFDNHNVKYARLDPSRLSQVLINLMTNAIKFTQGRENRSIIVSLGMSRDISETSISYLPRNTDQRMPLVDIHTKEWGTGDVINIHCSVEDTGRGLSEEELKILFQRFQQATPRTHVQYGGSGLGLFISRILTEMQGGQIGVSSSHGQGSKFSFYIQCRKSDREPNCEPVTAFKLERKYNQQTPPPSNNLAISAAASPASAARNATPSTAERPLYDVLIVEDNLVNQKVLQRQLRNCGNNIFVANHGQEALQTLERSRFWSGQESNGVDISVVLMDLEMPVMDGMTCAKRIRELQREGTIVKHIPIIAVTAYARPEQIAAAKEAGIVSQLTLFVNAEPFSQLTLSLLYRTTSFPNPFESPNYYLKSTSLSPNIKICLSSHNPQTPNTSLPPMWKKRTRAYMDR